MICYHERGAEREEKYLKQILIAAALLGTITPTPTFACRVIHRSDGSVFKTSTCDHRGPPYDLILVRPARTAPKVTDEKRKPGL